MVQKDIFQNISLVKISWIIILLIIPNIVKAEVYQGYEQIEYIESTGSQYIDTDYKPNLFQVQIEMKLSDMTNNGFIYGVNNGSYDSYSLGWYHNTANNQYDWVQLCNNVSSGYKIGRNNEEIIYKLLQPNEGNTVYGRMTWNGENTFINLVRCNQQQQNNIYIFGVNWNNQRVEQKTAYKLYYMKIWLGDNIRRDFIPVKRLNDEKCGLLDKENMVFYDDENGGSFLCGESIEPDPGPTPTPSGDGVLADFINIYIDRFQYLANGIIENEYLFSMVVVIIAFIVLEIFIKIFNIRRGGKR